MIKFIIFDFDGTLVNTLPLTSEAVRRFLKYKNINKTISSISIWTVDWEFLLWHAGNESDW